MSMHMSTHMSIHISIRMPMNMSILMSINMSIRMPIGMCIHLSISTRIPRHTHVVEGTASVPPTAPTAQLNDLSGAAVRSASLTAMFFAGALFLSND